MNKRKLIVAILFVALSFSAFTAESSKRDGIEIGTYGSTKWAI